jgi:3-hydroxyacyl-CoA dehydrogenase
MAAVNDVVDLSNEGDIAVITINSPPVNALGWKVREGLVAAAKQAFADAAAKAVVLICAGRTFIAGADITEFGGGEMKGPSFNEVMATLEGSTKPLVAAIHGTALGGGLETALACNYRVATPSAKVGFPEVQIGILPGAGGTQRLPRLIPVMKALEMMLTGDHVSAKAANAMGLIDELAGEDTLRADAVAYAKKLVAEGAPLKKVRDLKAEASPEIFAGARFMTAKKGRGFVAPEKIIQAVEGAVSLPFDEGLALEQKLFLELLTGPQSAALRYLFFAHRDAWKVKDIPADTPLRPIRKVGVVGAGLMGGGIAMNFASAGIPVTIVEMKQEALDKGLATVRKNYEGAAERGKIKPEAIDGLMAQFTPTLTYDDLHDCDLIIEAVFENMDVKKQVFAKLDAVAKPGAILATNTSYLNLDEIAAATKRPQDVIGLHFFSPANIMRLLEVVRGDKSAPDTIATAMDLAKKIRKVAVLAGVTPGFIGNRMLVPRQVQAEKLLLEGAMPWQVDKVWYDLGMPMGPFAMYDLAGLDLGWNKDASAGRDSRELLNEAGRYGQKTKAGYYDYDDNRKSTPSPVTQKIIEDYRARQGVTPREIGDEEILERTLYPLINEGAKILEEGKASRASDIDVVWVNGYGFPPYLGGPMYYAGVIGLKKIVAKLEEIGVEPSALLRKLAAEGKTFADAK